MGLIDALREWESQWRAAGGPIDEGLAPGLSEAEVRAVIDWIEPHPDLLTWFSWRGGNAPGVMWFNLPPTKTDQLNLEGLLNWRRVLEAVVPMSAEVPYDPAWVPLLADDESRTILMDQRTGEILRFETLNEVDPRDPALRKVSDDLESLVRRWIRVNENTSLTWSQEDEVFEYDESKLAREDKHLGIVG